MKKLVNDPNNVVEEMIEGIAMSSPHVKLLKGANVIVRADCKNSDVRSKVAIISGGGSGHEPAHAGFVGKGMLSAAVCGNVFASPNPSQVLAAIRAVTGPAGVLLIVKSYTGDRLNFGIAAELARAEGYLVEMVIVADDCALISNQKEHAGRRGIAGTVLVHKIAGATAESGMSLQEVTRVARKTAENVGTVGLGLSPCIVPSAGKPSFSLGEGEIELGLGIHGEAGVEKMELKPADQLVDQILDIILSKSPSLQVTPAPTHLVVLVNNLGGTTNMELSIVARRAILYLEKKGFSVEKCYVSALMTALDMAGVSISILPVSPFDMPLLDLPTTATGWPNTAIGRPNGSAHFEMDQVVPHTGKDGLPHASVESQLPLAQHDQLATLITQFISSAANQLVANKNFLDDLDSQVGDGDIGTSLDRASHKLLAELPALTFQNPPASFKVFAGILQNSLGGTSGPLYTVFFLRLAAQLAEAHKEGIDYHDAKVWAAGFQAGVKGIMELGDAKKGDCTMLDALIPAIDAIQKSADNNGDFATILQAADEAARSGAESTKELTARRGRTSYLGDRAQGHIDPGAKAISLIFQSFLRLVK